MAEPSTDFIDMVRGVIERFQGSMTAKGMVEDLEELIAELESEEDFDDPEAA